MSDLLNLAEKVESELRALLNGEFSSLTLSFNEQQGPNYQTAQQFDEDSSWHGDWVSQEERAKAVEGNSVWTLQWYPDTPIGFHAINASSLPALFAALRSSVASEG